MPETEGRLKRILGWLRTGYQDGIPGQDYVPLLEVLHRQLTDAEVDAVVVAIIEQAPEPIDVHMVTDAMRRRVLEKPSEDDVARVIERLESAGYTVQPPPEEGEDGKFLVREDF